LDRVSCLCLGRPWPWFPCLPFLSSWDASSTQLLMVEMGSLKLLKLFVHASLELYPPHFCFPSSGIMLDGNFFVLFCFTSHESQKPRSSLLLSFPLVSFLLTLLFFFFFLWDWGLNSGLHICCLLFSNALVSQLFLRHARYTPSHFRAFTLTASDIFSPRYLYGLPLPPSGLHTNITLVWPSLTTFI
jgi:hypothetical protein